MMDNKPIFVLKQLLDGASVVVDDQEYLFDADNHLCLKVANTPNNKLVLLKVNFGDVSIAQFIEWANKISDDDLVIAAGNAVLNKIHHRSPEHFG